MDDSVKDLFVEFGGLLCHVDVRRAFVEHFGEQAEAEAEAARTLWDEQVAQDQAANNYRVRGSIARDGRVLAWQPGGDGGGQILTVTNRGADPERYSLELSAFFRGAYVGPSMHAFWPGRADQRP